MRTGDGGSQRARERRGGAEEYGSGRGRGRRFIPSTWRAISSYLRSVSSNASSVAAGVRTATSAASMPQGDDYRLREEVQWASFDKLELSSGHVRHMLLLTYMNGFQVWDVEDAGTVREIVSRRDGHVAFLRLQPWPHPKELRYGAFNKAHPLVLVATGDYANRAASIPGGFPGAYGGEGLTSVQCRQFVPTVVRFYSLQIHSYINELRFRTGVYAVQCSSRVVAVALANQIHCFNAATLKSMFIVATYPIPEAGLGAGNVGNSAMALGPRWLAYASNEPLMACVGRVSPQHLSSSCGISPSTSPNTGGYIVHYAKESSKQIAAGVMTLGDIGYRKFSKYCSEFVPESVAPNYPGQKVDSSGSKGLSEYAGTVVVRDIVNDNVVAHFRAHTSPLSALCFDPSGTLLITASVHGHNLNIFRLAPSSAGHCGSATSCRTNPSYAHLYKLYRGLTNAVIQDIAFSMDSRWVAVSSSRGTSHLYAISPFGGIVGPRTHRTASVDGYIGTALPTPWWTDSGPLGAPQQLLSPPPAAITLSALARIKNGLGGWRSAACRDSSSGQGGVVAAMFHDGSQIHSETNSPGILRDKLWVLSASGHLIRYLLHPSPGEEGGYGSNGMNSEGSSSSGQSQDFRLVVEASEQWDVCRGLNWVEHQERAKFLEHKSSEHMAGNGDEFGARMGRERPARENEEVRRWCISNAELQTNQSQQCPLWAQPNVFFQVMLDKSLADVDIEDDPQIEFTPSRVIEVRRKDLKPVRERFPRFSKPHGVMRSASERATNLTCSQNLTSPDGKLQDGPLESSFANLHIHRSSSGSSLGSEAPLGEPLLGMNGFHPSYRDSPDIYLTQNSDSPPPLRGYQHSANSVEATISRSSTGIEDGAGSSSSERHLSPGLPNAYLPVKNSTTEDCCFCLQKKLKDCLVSQQTLDTDCCSDQVICKAPVQLSAGTLVHDDGIVRTDQVCTAASQPHGLVHCINGREIDVTSDTSKIPKDGNVSGRSTASKDGDSQDHDGWEGDLFPFGDED